MLKKERVSPFELTIPRHGNMLVDATVYASEDILIEDSALDQLASGASIPGVKRALATPDIHHGFGVPIGSVLGMDGAIVPAAVGFDINCGMRVLTTNLHARQVNYRDIAHSTRRDIPLGEGKSNIHFQKRDLEAVLAEGVAGLLHVKKKNHQVWDHFNTTREKTNLQRIEDSGSLKGIPGAVGSRAMQRGADQLATLGGGNHFIEFQIVEKLGDVKIAERFGLFEGQLLVMIHSGSRGLGHQVGGDYMKLAQKRNPGAVPFLELHSKEGQNYLGAMHAAANYAFANRHLMGLLVEKNLQQHYPKAKINLLYDVPHNIAKLENHGRRELMVHRKGATRAFGPRRMRGSSFADTGQPVLIPGSMGTASYILAGIDDDLKNLASVNHGAGRTMSRTAARGKWKGSKMLKAPAISRQAFEKSMQGVELLCNSSKGILEEAPQAYKNIDSIIETVLGAGLANFICRCRPLAVLKG